MLPLPKDWAQPSMMVALAHELDPHSPWLKICIGHLRTLAPVQHDLSCMAPLCVPEFQADGSPADRRWLFPKCDWSADFETANMECFDATVACLEPNGTRSPSIGDRTASIDVDFSGARVV